MGAGGTKTTTQANYPWWLDKFGQQAGSEAQRLYQDPRFSTPPPQSQATLYGLQQQEQMARAGSPVAQGASAESARTLSGQYLDPASNPWLKTIADRAAGEASSEVASRFGGSGRLGSGAYAGALADSQMGTRAAIYGDAYNQERGRMQQALATAPSSYGLGSADARTLQEVGAAQEMEAQRQFDWPYELLNRYTSSIYGNPMLSNPGSTSNSKKSLNWLDIVGGIGGALQPSMGGGG